MKNKRKVFDDIKTGDVIYRVLFYTTNPFKIRTIREIIPLTVTSIEKGNSPYKNYEYYDVKTDGGYGFIMNLEKNPENIKSEKLKFGRDLEVIFDRNTVEELINKTIEYHESELEKVKTSLRSL